MVAVKKSRLPSKNKGKNKDKAEKKTLAELETMGDRLRWARERLGLSQLMLAKEVGLSQMAISMLEKRQSDGQERRTKSIVKIARALKCSTDWLESGIGHITETSAPIYRVPVIAWENMTKWKDHIKNPLETILMYNFDAPYWFSTPLPNNFMKSPDPAQSFEEGDLVLFDPRLKPKNGSFVFAVKRASAKTGEGEPLFRKLIVEGGKKYLVASQEGIRPIEVDKTVEIYGVAVGKEKLTIIVDYNRDYPELKRN